MFRPLALWPTPAGFKSSFEDDYRQALDFLFHKLDVIQDGLEKQGADATLMIPVVFPELVRYSILRDKAEAIGLKVFYVRLGEDYANFSIGRFQMKPSFVTRLEQYAVSVKPCQKINQYNTRDARKKRAARVSRLENLLWQVKYLACFAGVVEKRFSKQLKTMSYRQKVKFYAATYNAGFYKTFRQIQAFSLKKYYPHGKMTLRQNYRYNEIALYFALQDLPRLGIRQ